jgi:Protein of unknown function (DUF2795)
LQIGGQPGREKGSAEMDMQQMQQMMAGMNYPTSKEDMMSWAMQHGASNEQMEMMRKLPMDRYDSFDDVKSAMSKMMKMT